MTVESMRQTDDLLEQLWFAGCYSLVYNWPTAERIWLSWRPEDFEPEAFLDWLQSNWDGIALRKERKAVFRKEFFTESARTYLAFAQVLVEKRESWTTETYETAFEDFLHGCKYMGRYIGIRWMEVMRRMYDLPWVMPDIRSDGGEHPRKALALIYPADAAMLLGGNSAEAIKVSDQAADRLLLELDLEYGIKSDYYELQSLLCEYKQSILGGKQYPGKSIDTEMDYARRIAVHWGDMPSSFYRVREIFPAWSRGELQGWDGARKDLGKVLQNHGYTWSDAVYNYPASKDDLAKPVVRPEGPGKLL